MQRVNLIQYYTFGHAIHRLTTYKSKEEESTNYCWGLNYALLWLDHFVEDKMIPMTISKGPAKRLVHTINNILYVRDQSGQFRIEKGEKVKTDWNVVPHDYFRMSVTSEAKDFETIFSAEIANMATYYVSKKGEYDTNTLIDSADEMFPPSMKADLAGNDKARRDIREAGKCLVFDLGTAAGFHITRAVESVVLQYLGELCPDILTDLKDNQRNLGSYITFATENGGDEKVCAALDQFRSLHRNPLIHPEEYIDVEEAMIMLGLAKSTIFSILLDIRERQKRSGT